MHNNIFYSFYVLQPLQIMVWICILCSMVGTALVLMIITKLSLTKHIKTRLDFTNFEDAMWLVVASFVAQGNRTLVLVIYG